MTTPTARQLEETRMIASWFREAAGEAAEAGGTFPPTLMAVIRARFSSSFEASAYLVGVPDAVALFAALAFAAGRKAERAGLVHEEGTPGG